MRVLTSLPAYMGFILKNIAKFDINEDQEKKLHAIKSVIRPKAHPFKDGVIETEESMSIFYKEYKDIEDVEKLSKKASELRIKFATIKLECRDQVIEVISNSQWQLVSKIFDDKMAYQINNSIENVCALPVNNLDKKKVDTTNLQTDITELEKEIQEMSLNNISKDTILNKVFKLEENRQELVSIILKDMRK